MSELHVLNGEGTAVNFRQSGIPGDLVVWNEALCTGPVRGDICFPSFWKMRAHYFDQEISSVAPTVNAKKYREIMIPELHKLEAISSYQRVTLWFENDLFCQINLMGVIAWMSQKTLQSTQVHLICINEFPAIPDFRGLGQFSPHQFQQIISLSKLLTDDDLHRAQDVWSIYSSQQPHELALLSPSPAFPYWERARELYFSRFPSVFNGLGALQQRILEMLKNGPKKANSLIRELLLSQGDWGLGDLQYLEILNSLHAAIDGENELHLNDIGKNLLKGNLDFMSLGTDRYALGGVLNNRYRWNGKTLIPQS
ncbi:MAG: hypothetical protein OER04_15220 [Cyclobacteriaceae bacterium]|nr:hypothetical protein [Cyclobacteriaceae bacterium]